MRGMTWVRNHTLLVGFFGLLIVLVGLFLGSQLFAQPNGKTLLVVYDRGQTTVFVTAARTVEDALNEQQIELDIQDTVEPSRKDELVAAEYRVNIYRARPVTVEDGAVRTQVLTPYQSAQRIATHAGMTLYPEDRTVLSRSPDITVDGAGLTMRVDRAVPFQLELYGDRSEVRTQATTVAEFLNDKNITLGERGRVSAPLESPIAEGMFLRVWREGRQTITVTEPIAFATERIFDADRPVGYREVQTPGTAGAKTITYEIEIVEGVEVSRTEIAQLVLREPVKEIAVFGIQPTASSLTKSKGAHIFVDSRGVAHRETYYDLEMNVVMQACGQRGYYEVRPDGAKIDADGYVIIAANLSRYPRCSVVETSLGPGKVYDTGGFAIRHPEGFDLATDWTNNNGR